MNLYLSGYRGSGKSTIAPLLGQQLDRQIVDSDQLVQQHAGCTIAAIFEQQGEPYFRELEQQVIAEIARRNDLVVALGGGATMFAANQNSLRNSGKTVYLKAEPEVLWARISSDRKSEEQRPDLTDRGGINEILTLMDQRGPVYEACADYTIDVGALTPQECVEQIVRWWQTVDKVE